VASGGKLNRKFFIVLVVVLLAGGATLAYTFEQRLQSISNLDREIALAQKQAASIRENTVVPTDQRVRAGENFTVALQKFGLSPEEAAGASAAAQHAFNLRQVRAGNTITVGRSMEGQLREIDYKIDADRMLKITPEDKGYIAQIREIPSRTEVVAVSGRLDDSLFNAVEDAGETAELAMRLSQIFGYDLDFYTDPRKGDTFRVVLERKNTRTGKLRRTEESLQRNTTTAEENIRRCYFTTPRGSRVTTPPVEKSLQKAFFRSPLKFGAPVTSHFSRARFHPILKTYRAHMGTDYGAPVGTPVQTSVAAELCLRAQGRRREHGADRARERVRDDVPASLANVCPRGRAGGNWQDDWTRGEHGTFDGAASRFPDSAKGAVQEF